jgi:hypothetical protein
VYGVLNICLTERKVRRGTTNRNVLAVTAYRVQSAGAVYERECKPDTATAITGNGAIAAAISDTDGSADAARPALPESADGHTDGHADKYSDQYSYSGRSAAPSTSERRGWR